MLGTDPDKVDGLKPRANREWVTAAAKANVAVMVALRAKDGTEFC